MGFEKFFTNADEKPLENIVTDGGFCGIFRTIGCIGDSLSSGEFEGRTSEGASTYNDYYDYSWGQFLARMCGSRAINFSRGGMTAQEFCEGFGNVCKCWDLSNACQAYVIAMGVNDLCHKKQEVGSVSDIDLSNYKNNKETFAGYYAQIIQRIKEIQPRAKFFLMTMPRSGDAERDAISDAHAKLLRDMAEFFDYTYVLDFNKYAPVYDEEFKDNFYLYGHMNPAGYLLTAKMVASYIDFIIRHNMKDFKQVGYIGTPHYEPKLD